MPSPPAASRATDVICGCSRFRLPVHSFDLDLYSIHESPDEGRRPNGMAAPAEIVSEGEGESAAESSVQGAMSPTTASTSEHSPETGITHPETKKNFYPVSWRVVGGGVMMSGKRTYGAGFP